MLKWTNVEADHVARQVEDAVQLLRGHLRHHSRYADAMYLIDEQMMGGYHQGQAEITRGVIDDLLTTAAHLRDRTAPATPRAPSGAAPARQRRPAPQISDYRRRQAIEAAATS